MPYVTEIVGSCIFEVSLGKVCERRRCDSVSGMCAVDMFLRDAEDSVKCGMHEAVESTPAG